MFTGLIIILLLIYSLFLQIEYKWKYMLLVIFSFLIMLGDNAFLHPLFYKYFPLFSSLRFPSTWRCILTIFVLLISAETLESIVGSEKRINIAAIYCLAVSVLFFVLYKFLPYISCNISVSENIINRIRNDLKNDIFIFLVYSILFFLVYYLKKLKNINFIGFLIIGVISDVFIGQHNLYPLTVTAYNQLNHMEMETAQTTVVSLFEKDKNRNHSIDYSNAERARSGFNSKDIIFNHLLDEEGYLSVLLDYVQKYKASEHCKLSYNVPEIYVTNDVVSDKEVNYNEWIEDTEVSPYQIFINDRTDILDRTQILESDIITERFISGDIRMSVSQNTKGYMVVQQSWYPGWSVYVDGKKEEIIKINETFLGVYLKEGKHTVRFVFKPLDFYIGIIITGIYFFLCIISFVLYLKKIKSTYNNIKFKNRIML